jgi:hypothetical protein
MWINLSKISTKNRSCCSRPDTRSQRTAGHNRDNTRFTNSNAPKNREQPTTPPGYETRTGTAPPLNGSAIP